MDTQTKIDLVRKGSVLEVLTEDELKNLFETQAHPSHYIGFEISGKVHLGTGLCTALKIKDFVDAGIKPTIFLADYHAYLNGKLGGDLDKIQTVARGYFKSAMYASLLCAGLDEKQADSVRFVMGSELYDEMGLDYWNDVMHVSKDTTMKRMLRCTTIMGRTESDNLPSSATLYPSMQVADIWALEADIAHAGMDQRKVHVLAREVAEKLKRPKPVAVHGALLSGLLGPGKRMDAADAAHAADADAIMIANKMSKSNPDSCIFIHDSPDEIARKLKKAYCPEKIIEDNPVVQMAETFVLRGGAGGGAGRALKVERPAKFGGDVEIADAAELRALFADGKLHPMDLKNAVGRELTAMLEPARKHFEKHPKLLEQAL